jgi:outer membrane protein OmpA-like peptidoglycan-associated protein
MLYFNAVPVRCSSTDAGMSRGHGVTVPRCRPSRPVAALPRTPELRLPMTRFRRAVLCTAAILPLSATVLAAQQFPGFGSIEARVGAASPEDAGTGLSTSVDLGLGFIGSPLLQTFVGFNYFDAGVNDPARGSIAGTGARIGLRLDLFGPAWAGPYLLASATAHNVSVDADTDIDRRAIERVFGGFVVGGTVGGGAHYALDGANRFLATAEVRRTFVANVPHWAAEVGVRIVPRGRDAYRRPFRFQDPYRVVPQQVGIAGAEAERARLAREREAAERARQERERFEGLTEEERRRLEDQASAERRRAEAEAAARAEAEAEAARLREEAALAEQRALDAEERLYRSLQDLDRLIANVTSVHQTERGLSLLLGQGLFAVGQSSLSPPAREEVQRIAAVLLQYPQYRIAVEGHTDATGSRALNQRLSEERAAAVRAALVAEGIAPDRVEARGHGQDLPIADNTTQAGRAMNRRVEIIILGAQAVDRRIP